MLANSSSILKLLQGNEQGKDNVDIFVQLQYITQLIRYKYIRIQGWNIWNGYFYYTLTCVTKNNNSGNIQGYGKT